MLENKYTVNKTEIKYCFLNNLKEQHTMNECVNKQTLKTMESNSNPRL